MRWNSAPLGEVATVLSGTTPKSEVPAYWNGPHVWVTPTDLGRLRTWEIADSERRITDAGVASCNLPLVPSGAIMMSSRAPIGHLAIAGCALRTNQGCKSFVCSSVLDPEFLFLTLRHRMPEIQALGSGATFVEVSKSALEAFVISFPKKNDQRRMATRLKTQLAAVEQARQAARAQLADVGALRASIERDIETRLFASHARMAFGEFVDSYRNGFGRRPKPGETGPVVLRIADVSSGTISLANPRLGAIDTKEAETYRLDPGDLLFVRVNGAKEIVGKCCCVDSSIPSDTIFNDHLIRVRLRDGLDARFAQMCMSLPCARASIESAASTSAGQLTVNQTILSEIEIPAARENEQTKVTREVDRQLAAIEQMRVAARTQLADIEALPARLLAQAFDADHAGGGSGILDTVAVMG